MIGTAGALRDAARECQANCAATVREIVPDGMHREALGSGLSRIELHISWRKTEDTGSLLLDMGAL